METRLLQPVDARDENATRRPTLSLTGTAKVQVGGLCPL
jgi:hypothetical protein